MQKGAISSVLAFALLVGACVTRPADPAAGARAPAKAIAPEPANAAAADPGDDGSADEDSEDTPASDSSSAEPQAPCADDMALVEATAPDGSKRRYCIDKYEASLVETLPDGTERPFPHYAVVDGHDVRAVSKPNVFPQGFISEVQARDACASSHKHLCTHDEWKVACMGPAHTTFPYGDARRTGVCHDNGKSAVGVVFGTKALAAAPSAPVKVSEAHASRSPVAESGKRAHVTKGRAASTTRARANAKQSRDTKKDPKKGATTKRHTGRKSTPPPSVDMTVWTRLNDPALGQVEGALSKTGDHAACVNGYGVFDMVGNLHEWVATDPSLPHGTFAGGYYLDTSQNGDGCNYRTVAHAHEYHDYSTGFRCCAAAK